MFRDHGQVVRAGFVNFSRDAIILTFSFAPTPMTGFDLCHVRDKFTQHDIVMPKGLA